MATLMFSSFDTVRVVAEGGYVVVTQGAMSLGLDRSEAVELVEAIRSALAGPDQGDDDVPGG